MLSKSISIAPAPPSCRPGSALDRIVPQRSQRDDLFEEQLTQTRTTTDRAFAVVLVLEWLCAILLARFISPRTWEGALSQWHPNVWAALVLGGIIVVPPALLAWTQSGKWWTRHLVATAQMLMAALYIHLTHGYIETHFMVFGSLAFLAFYRDWKVLITASLVVLADHLIRGAFIPESVFRGIDTNNPGEFSRRSFEDALGDLEWLWRSLVHFWWVVFEDIFLIFAIVYGNRVLSEVARRKVSEMGQYELKEKLGEGGMGEVYLAEHRLLRRPCAIKLARPDVARKAAMLMRFEREVQTTARLRHHNTVEIYDYGHLEDGTFFYVMEHLAGLNLEQLVEKYGPLPAPRVVYLLRQVCGALDEAHKIGLVHRDVKPANILVCCLGGQLDVAKLFDFGLVRTVGEDDPSSKLTKVGSALGTPDYMSPEQVTGGEVDHRSDIFSLGAVAYFLLTGKPPYDGPNTLAVMYARVSDPAKSPRLERPELPTDVERIVMRCLEREKHARYADAMALHRELGQCACAREWGDEQASTWWDQESGDALSASSLQATKLITTCTTPRQE